MTTYRIMEHAPIRNYTYPFYVEEWVPGGLLRFGRWDRFGQYSAFATYDEAKLFIERNIAEGKLQAEQRRSVPREVVRGYVASDGVFHPLASE